MAERRMFAKSIIDSDTFLDLPVAAQSLYFHIGMHADDEGFVDSPRRVMRMTGTTEDDMRLLVEGRLLIRFESGTVVIRHWKVHNYIRGDRFKPTMHQHEKSLLTEDSNGIYGLAESPTADRESAACLPSVSIGKDSTDKYSINKYSINKDSIDSAQSAQTTTTNSTSSKKRFVKPTLDEVAAYCQERANNIDAQHFIDYYNANGWHVGKNPMNDWQSAIRNWERNTKQPANPPDLGYSKMPMFGVVL